MTAHEEGIMDCQPFDMADKGNSVAPVRGAGACWVRPPCRAGVPGTRGEKTVSSEARPTVRETND
jgi:hypothetical protein